jgi:hypothetical protein
MWVHELCRDGHTLCYLMFPIDRLKHLAAKCYREGRRASGGDGGHFKMVLVPLSEILK